jgi:methyl-accepting chemotaxis protein
LSDRLWPAILISVPIFMVLSVWVTNRFAGPVYRLEQSLKQIAAGDLGMQVRFRSGDDLQELAGLVNQIIHRQSEVLRTVQSVHQRLLETMAQIRSKTVAPEQLNPMLEQIQIQIEQVESLLRQFKLGRPAPSKEISKKIS